MEEITLAALSCRNQLRHGVRPLNSCLFCFLHISLFLTVNCSGFYLTVIAGFYWSLRMCIH